MQKQPKINVNEQGDGQGSELRTFRRKNVTLKRRRLADAPLRLPAVPPKYRRNLVT